MSLFQDLRRGQLSLRMTIITKADATIRDTEIQIKGPNTQITNRPNIIRLRMMSIGQPKTAGLFSCTPCMFDSLEVKVLFTS